MEVIKFYGGAIVLLGFIYFILIRAISTKNYKRKSLFLLIAGAIITTFFLLGIGYDIVNGYFNVFKKELEYYAFLIISLLYTIGISLFYYILGKSRKQQFQNNFKHMKSVQTIKEKNEYVYIITKVNDSFYLKKFNDKDQTFYKGVTLKFGNKEFFHDEIVKEYIVEKNMDIISYKYIGKAIKKDNKKSKDHVYYCYRVLLNSMPSNFNDYELIDSYKLLSVNLKDEDKKILFTSVVQDDFNIEI